jgi:hypothetical protein
MNAPSKLEQYAIRVLFCIIVFIVMRLLLARSAFKHRSADKQKMHERLGEQDDTRRRVDR